MTLGELKQLIESKPERAEFNYTLSRPFSWRGSYAEVAFAIEEIGSTRQQLLIMIEEAFTNEFTGYKGGEYTYNEHTEVNFEEDTSSWSDGEYITDLIEKIEDKKYEDPDIKLLNLVFS